MAEPFSPGVERDIGRAMKHIGRAMDAVMRIEKALPPDEPVTTAEPKDRGRIFQVSRALGGASDSLISFSEREWPRGAYYEDIDYERVYEEAD